MKSFPGLLVAALAGSAVLAPAIPAPATAAGRTPPSTSRVSVSTSGAQGDRVGLSPAISANGRYVAFTSYASNLVPGDSNNAYDIFVRDLGC